VEHVAEIDRRIEESAENWRLARMPVMDRLILRLAVYEFLHQPETPQPVILDEALELAKRFSTPEAVKFINGVLEGVRIRLRPDAPTRV
jgi:transcription antitermination protein NusB